ncbi:hypothetical protein G6F63_015590 [Rhizopus arrhizus]|nr:hypothetical protein G6F63_015590 [Rhizopus arrhizus]
MADHAGHHLCVAQVSRAGVGTELGPGLQLPRYPIGADGAAGCTACNGNAACAGRALEDRPETHRRDRLFRGWPCGGWPEHACAAQLHADRCGRCTAEPARFRDGHVFRAPVGRARQGAVAGQGHRRG